MKGWNGKEGHGIGRGGRQTLAHKDDARPQAGVAGREANEDALGACLFEAGAEGELRVSFHSFGLESRGGTGQGGEGGCARQRANIQLGEQVLAPEGWQAAHFQGRGRRHCFCVESELVGCCTVLVRKGDGWGVAVLVWLCLSDRRSGEIFA